jgi:hypothetical protein
MKEIEIKKIKPNPNNPRIIKDDKFKKLVQSLKDLPEMAKVRPIVVNKDMIVLGGNMRLKAMQEAGWKKAPVEVVDWDEEKQKQFIIKDNIAYGEWDWDVLANNWDNVELAEWGLIPTDYGVDVNKLAFNTEDTHTEEITHNDLQAENSHVKMVQLFMTKEDHDRFVKDIDTLADLYNTDNVTDTILRLIRESIK